MFIRDETRLAVGFPDAAARLTDLARHGRVMSASEAAYAAGLAHLEGSYVPGRAAEMFGLVRARVRELAGRPKMAGLALRWEAHGPGGELFPALDADITLSPDGVLSTAMAMAGVYRVSANEFGRGLDAALVRRVASETARTFVGLMAAAIVTPQPGIGTDHGAPPGGGSWPPAYQAP